MYREDVSRKRSMFSEGLATALESFASIFFLRCVASLMPTQSCARRKSLVTVGPVADVVPLDGMCALKMVLQMRVAEEGFATSCLGTAEWALIGVRAKMFGEATLPVEGLQTALKRAVENFAT